VASEQADRPITQEGRKEGRKKGSKDENKTPVSIKAGNFFAS
jgi:hypothetical protein